MKRVLAVGMIRPRFDYNIFTMGDRAMVRVNADIGQPEFARITVAHQWAAGEPVEASQMSWMRDHAFAMIEQHRAGEDCDPEPHLHWAASSDDEQEA